MNQEKLFGSWDLVSVDFIGPDGKRFKRYTDASTGLLIYAADRHMSAAIDFVEQDGRHRPVFYAGPLEIGDDYTVHHVRFSSEPELVGTEQKRFVSFNGDHLVLTSPASIIGGPGVRAEIVWQRHR